MQNIYPINKWLILRIFAKVKNKTILVLIKLSCDGFPSAEKKTSFLGLSDEIIKPLITSDNSLAPALCYTCNKTRVKTIIKNKIKSHSLMER